MVSKVREGRRVFSNFTPKALLQQLTLEATARYHGTFLRLLGMTGAEPHKQPGRCLLSKSVLWSLLMGSRDSQQRGPRRQVVPFLKKLEAESCSHATRLP